MSAIGACSGERRDAERNALSARTASDASARSNVFPVGVNGAC